MLNCLEAVSLDKLYGWNSDLVITWGMVTHLVSCAESFNIPSDVHSYLFCAIASSKEKEIYISHVFCTIMWLELNQASARLVQRSVTRTWICMHRWLLSGCFYVPLYLNHPSDWSGQSGKNGVAQKLHRGMYFYETRLTTTVWWGVLHSGFT